MNLANFLNKIFKRDGFVLVDYNSKKYQIGKPVREKPINLKILDKSLHYKLLFYPDLYFGEAYTNGSLIIENGTLAEFLSPKNFTKPPNGKAAICHLVPFLSRKDNKTGPKPIEKTSAWIPLNFPIK